jgi:NhaP-type Na+/H+ or K+/H+ antiporter
MLVLALSLITGYTSQGVFSYAPTKQVPFELILAVACAMIALVIGKPELALIGRFFFSLNAAKTAIHILGNKE